MVDEKEDHGSQIRGSGGKLLLGVVVASMGAANSQAQHWRSVGNGVVGPSSVVTLYGDSVSDRLLAGGTFLWVANDLDTVLGVGQAAWNGERWDSLATRIQPIISNWTTDQTTYFLRFEGALYASGHFGFEVEPNQWNVNIAKLDEVEQRWKDLGCLNSGTNGMGMIGPRDPGQTLYATGFTGSICGHPEACVFRYDGEGFQPWEPFEQIPAYHNNYVGSVFDFRGKTYMTGFFRDPNSDWFLTLARFNGSTWESVPGWNTLDPIRDTSIRNDTLYVAGAMRLAGGAPGNGVAYFDGTDWNEMGGGLANVWAPSDMDATVLQWYRDELYVSGKFNTAGGVAVDHIAKWNGHQWCGLPGDIDTPGALVGGLNDMTVWRDSLYVCGRFTTIDGEPVRHVAQWIGGDATVECSEPVSVAEAMPALAFTLYPNPTSGVVQVEATGLRPQHWYLVDALGRTVAQGGATAARFAVDLSALGNGLYHLVLEDAHGLRHARPVYRAP